jgi:hypothetical protein
MLTGVFLFLFGIGFGINSVSLVLVFTPLYVLVNVWELKQIEEPELVKRQGTPIVAQPAARLDLCFQGVSWLGPALPLSGFGCHR